MGIRKLTLASITKHGTQTVQGNLKGCDVMVTDMVTGESGLTYGFSTDGADIVDGKVVMAMSSHKDSGKITTIKPADYAAHNERTAKLIQESEAEINVFRR